MNIDEQIKQELENEAKTIDAILVHREGLFTMMLNAFKGALGVWMIVVSIVVLLITALMVWAGYQFFFVPSGLEDKLHWAVVLLVCLVVQVATKMWTFMEMNRMSVIREIKRLEITINSK